MVRGCLTPRKVSPIGQKYNWHHRIPKIFHIKCSLDRYLEKILHIIWLFLQCDFVLSYNKMHRFKMEQVVLPVFLWTHKIQLLLSIYIQIIFLQHLLWIVIWQLSIMGDAWKKKRSIEERFEIMKLIITVHYISNYQSVTNNIYENEVLGH